MILSSLAAAFSPFAQANPLTSAVQGVAANASSAPAASDSSSAANSSSTAVPTTTPSAHHHHHRHGGGGSTSASGSTANTTSGTGTATQPAAATSGSTALGNLIQSFETALESALSGQGTNFAANPAQAAGSGTTTTTLFA